MNRQDTIAEAVLSTRHGVTRFLAGFDDSNHTRQAPSLPNHVAWNLGHLALTMHRAAGLIRPGDTLPKSDFVEGGTPSGGGDARRFATESVAFGSKPVNDPAQYPGLARCVEIYNGACAAVAAAVRGVPDATLDEVVPWGGGQGLPRWLLALRMMTHNGMHAGQIADLRRALGFKSIFS
jgi:hypothetical protein